MKVLLVCPHFTPDLHAATGEVMTHLVHSLADLGHEVSVITSLPWYKEHDVEPEWRGKPFRKEKTSWGKIIRVWPFPTSKTNIPARALGFIGFSTIAAVAAVSAGKQDLVMGMSPPIFLGEAAYIAARRSRCPLVFNVQDIFPDIAIELGALRNQKVIAVLKKYEKLLYKRADALTVLSEDQRRNVCGKLPAEDDMQKVHIIKNFVDFRKVFPVEREGSYREKHGLQGKTVVMYSGNVGFSQSFDLIRYAAKEFASNPQVAFVINGEGAARPEVDAWAKQMSNVVVSDFGPREEVSSILGAADLHLILLKKGLAKSSTPSKLYGILAAERPILASVDEGSEVASTVEDAGSGVAIAPDNPVIFVETVKRMLKDEQKLVEMGERGRVYARQCLTPEHQAARYSELFEKLIR